MNSQDANKLPPHCGSAMAAAEKRTQALEAHHEDRKTRHQGHCFLANGLMCLGRFIVIGLLASTPSIGTAQPWLNDNVEVQNVFDPTRVLEIALTMDQKDWDKIRYDDSYDIYVPAWFLAAGDESAKPVAIRRKSSRALPDESNPWKIGMKIDLNEIDDLAWRGLTKLSLENGGDISPVKEGLAWNLHRLASAANESGYNYDGGLAAWVNVTLVLIGNDQAPRAYNLGVFTSVEQRDKQFARNRGLWNPTLVKNTSWIYEQDDINSPVIEDGPDSHSPQYNVLSYPPFRAYDKKNPTATPVDSILYQDLTTWIDMEAMLTFAAVEAFINNSDGLFTHGKNFLWGDYVWDGAPKRQYYAWDLDTAFRDVNALIYANSVSVKRDKVTYSQSPYQQIILNHPQFRAQYNAVFRNLLAQPLSEANIHKFISSVEAALTPYLEADPFVQSPDVIEGSIPGHFQALRDWVSLRIPRIQALIDGNNTPPPRAQ